MCIFVSLLRGCLRAFPAEFTRVRAKGKIGLPLVAARWGRITRKEKPRGGGGSKEGRGVTGAKVEKSPQRDR